MSPHRIGLDLVDHDDPNYSLLVLRGRLDTAGVDAVQPRFDAATSATGRHALVDLSQVEVLTSMGIRMLLSAARAMAGHHRRLVLFGACELVRDVLDIAAIDSVVPHAGDLAAARALLTA
jgi:anti-sigma B factor antagonist